MAWLSWSKRRRRSVWADSSETSTYDALGRLTRKDFDDGTTELRLDQTYRADGQLASQIRYADLAGTTTVATTSYAYDAGGRLTGLHHREGDGDTITQATYVYDDHGRLTQQVLDGTPTTFTYDDADQLTGDGTSTFTFDANGNRTNSSHATTTGNRLTTDGTWNYSYDDEGNLTGKTGVSTGEVWSYGYDHRNQMVLAEHKASSSDPVDLRVAFKYDSAIAWKSRWMPTATEPTIRSPFATCSTVGTHRAPPRWATRTGTSSPNSTPTAL